MGLKFLGRPGGQKPKVDEAAAGQKVDRPSEPTWLQDLIVKARKSDFISRRKHLIPSSLRQWGWNVVRSRSVFPVLGSQVYIPPEARNQGLALDNYEPEVTARIQQLLLPGMTFCDVGANIGIMTLLAARLVGPSGRVIAFEPIPENAEILRGNIQRNGYRNVTVLEKAVAVRPGRAEIHLSDLCGCHSLIPNPSGSHGRKLSIETVRLDSLPELQTIDLLKIDVEGAEIEVLKSLGNIRPRHVILEYNSERCRAAGLSWQAFYRNLRELGFSAVECLDDPRRDLEKLGDENISINLYLRGFSA